MNKYVVTDPNTGVPKYILSKRLFESQKCIKNLEAIKSVHQLKMDFYDLIRNESDQDILKFYVSNLTQCEFELQRLWKFPLDPDFHRFWYTPKCECPKFDNEDNYPYGRYITSANCPLHWEKYD